MNLIEAKAVRLDEDTDAGEFVYQNVWNTSAPRPMQEAMMTVLTSEDCTPERFAQAVMDNMQAGDWTSSIMWLDRLSGAIEEYGMEFDGMRSRREMTHREYDLADRGVASALRFVRAAASIVRYNR